MLLVIHQGDAQEHGVESMSKRRFNKLAFLPNNRVARLAYKVRSIENIKQPANQQTVKMPGTRRNADKRKLSGPRRSCYRSIRHLTNW
eukprot:5036288-Pleurochrysis_carterae.AAC.1